MIDLQKHPLIDLVKTMVLAQFQTPPVPVEALDAAVDQLRVVFPQLGDAEVDTIRKILRTQIKVTMDAGAVLTAHNHVKWLADKASTIEWDRWAAYKQMLMTKGFGMNVIARLDETTADIVDCVGDPTLPGPWKRRGLVIGDVQSGKTASYLGVVNRAADVGYKLIILLAGGTEALRKQTQLRVDEGLFGKNSAANGKIFGAGLSHKPNMVAGQAMTTQMTDFRKSSKEAAQIVIDPQASAPLVFVLKKNKTALENVRDWIKEQQIGDAPVDVPMLLVDDESDYASVNTKGEEDPTRINELIREILGTVTKSSYLAFTATPFANVFIDHETSDEALGDDLFPKDYIRTLEAPKNYVGSTAYFGTLDEPDDIKLLTPDDAAEYFPLKHKSHLNVQELPESLREAIRTFIVASALREFRGDTESRSMLVNVSRFKKVQAQVHELVEKEFVRLRNSIELHASSIPGGTANVDLLSLEKTFELRYGDLGVPWVSLAGPLKAAVHGVTVQLINSDRVKASDDISDLETDRMIAVGGDVLSRGLTLEGLTVSYFHRQAGAADTLLQMARWFGYRPGYDDLCRVWILPEVADHFRYVDSVVRELRDQVRVMQKQGLTPADFGLRVRMHPESLLITARNKMQAAEAKPWTIDVAGARHLETVKVSASHDDILTNKKAFHALVGNVESLGSFTSWDEGDTTIRSVTGVPQEVVADFLDSYVGYFADLIFADSALANFVRTGPDKYAKWTVGVVQGAGKELAFSDQLSLKVPQRGVLLRSAQAKGGALKKYFMISGDKARLAGTTDVAKAGGVKAKNAQSEPAVYGTLSHPVLLLYPMELTPKKVGAKGVPIGKRLPDAATSAAISRLPGEAEFVLGVKVGIPGDPNDRSAQVKYMLNSVALSNWAGAELDDPAVDLSEVDGGTDD